MLLAILILSAMMAISFSLATIMFVQIRSSGDLLRSEGSLYGASAVSEEVLFSLKRSVTISNYDSPAANAVATSTLRSLNDNIIQVMVPPAGAGGNAFATASVHYPIYNSSNPTGGSGYGKLKITYLNTGSTGSLSVYMCQFDPTVSYGTDPCTDPGNSQYWLSARPGGDILSPNQAYQTLTYDSSKNFTSTMQQELILANSSGNNIYVQIESFASDGATRLGLPIFGQQVVDITSTTAGVTRKLRVSVPNPVASGSSGAASGYAHHRLVTITGSVPSTQTNFPVLINIASSDPVAASLKSSVQSAQGYDIAFAQNADGSSPLNSEVESYNSGTGALVAWINVPTLSNGATFYMFYGKAGVSSPPNPPSAVWDSNYQLVQHQMDSSASKTVTDSTSNGNAGTSVRNTSAMSTAGQIGNGFSFNGSSDGISYSGITIPSTCTISVWLKQTGSNSGYQNVIAYGNSEGFWMYNGRADWYFAGDRSGNTTLPLNTWAYVTIVQDGSGTHWYYNRTPDGSNGFAFSGILTLNGTGKDNSGSEYFSGSMDELQVSNIARSANWITTEYNNQSSPSAFYTFGAEQ